MEDVEVLRRGAQVGDALDRRGPGSDDPDPLVVQAVEPAVSVASGVVVVPAARMEGVPGERLDSRDAGKLGPTQGADRHADEPGANTIGVIRVHVPAGVVFVPTDRRGLGVETGPGVEVVVPPDGLAVGVDLGTVGVLFRRDVIELFEEGQVDIGLDIALGAGVAVPVPGSAEVPPVLDDPELVDTGVPEPRGCEQPTETAADDDDVHAFFDALAPGFGFGGRVVQVVCEFVRRLAELVVAVRSDPLGAFARVLLAQGVRVEAESAGLGPGRLGRGGRHGSFRRLLASRREGSRW